MKGSLLLVDTHAHLTHVDFDGDRDDVIRNAGVQGVGRIVTAGTDLASSIGAVGCARTYEVVQAAVGIHPTCADRFDDESADVRMLLTEPEVCAVGEIGLDYVHCSVARVEQRRAFRSQLAWAVECNLPVVVHDREAHEDVLADLREYGTTGVLHCFTGDLDMMYQAVSMNLFISFAGNISYKKATNLHLTAQNVPLRSLLLETDSPYLAPQRWRGRRNEPAHVTEVAARIAELRDCSLNEVVRATSENAATLFRWESER